MARMRAYKYACAILIYFQEKFNTKLLNRMQSHDNLYKVGITYPSRDHLYKVGITYPSHDTTP